MQHRLVIGLGANLGDPAAQLQSALVYFSRLIDGRVTAVSSVYHSRALLHPDNPAPQPDYQNQVAIITTSHLPESLLDSARRVETLMGRDHSLPVWSPRPIDIDLLDYDGVAHRSNRLVLPHTQLSVRRFVLIPWLEIDSDAKVLGQPLKKLVNDLK